MNKNQNQNPYLERLYNGLIKENPVLVLMLGMCPALAVSTSAYNGFGMGLSSTAVLVLANLVISLLRKVIPDEVRLPAFIVVVATLVTIVELVTQAYIPALYAALGIYIPLIVVNCIILGRAEAYASKNTPGKSIFDGIGMGLGFTIALTLAGLIREFIGAGTAFGFQVLPDSVEPIGIFVKAPGAFMVFAAIVIVQNALGIKTRQRELVEEGCTGMCATCNLSCATGEAVQKAREEKKRMEEEARAKAIAAAKAAKEAKEAAAAAAKEAEGKEVQK